MGDHAPYLHLPALELMHAIHVIGLGLTGSDALPASVQQHLQAATIIAGHTRHISTVTLSTTIQTILLDGNLHEGLQHVQQCWQQGEQVVILVSGDPLFFGLGRLLTAQFPPESLVFHPHLSSVQLAFSRLRLPWHDAQFVSIHGRDLDPLRRVLQQGREKIAVLTDPIHSPGAIAILLDSLHLPFQYTFWVCENLGGTDERVQCYSYEELPTTTFASLTVVVLIRQAQTVKVPALPILGLPDDAFLSFPDRPGLITKREIRLAILGELALQPQQTVWDIGAGTGSVAIEVARLTPNSQVFAIEKTAMGVELIQKNCDRLQVENIQVVQGRAIAVLDSLPDPDRVFIGGSGGELGAMLAQIWPRLKTQGRLVCAFATLEHLMTAWQWFEENAAEVTPQLMQLNVARSLPFSGLHRLTPLNPVTILTATKP